jgi:hypothetical protein
MRVVKKRHTLRYEHYALDWDDARTAYDYALCVTSPFGGQKYGLDGKAGYTQTVEHILPTMMLFAEFLYELSKWSGGTEQNICAYIALNSLEWLSTVSVTLVVQIRSVCPRTEAEAE